MKTLLLAVLLAQTGAGTEITTENVLALMNAYRVDAGLPPLREDPRLKRAAEDRMRHMEDIGYWSHEAPDGMSPFTWITSRQYDFTHAAENLAAGFETAGFLVKSWMDSSGHRENIMSPDFEDVGIAIIEGGTRGPATGKSVVVLFGGIKQPMVVRK